MPQTLFWKDFKSGWIPSDDSISGRKDGLLQMDNLELDQNGALTLCGGTSVVRSYGSPPHTLYSRTIGGVRYDYTGLNNGQILRNNQVIANGGNGSNAGFSNAFDFVLGCSGDKRVKDTGVNTYNLGIAPAAVAPTFTTGGFYDTSSKPLILTDAIVVVVGSANSINLTLTTNVTEIDVGVPAVLSVAQSHHIANAPLDWSITKDIVSASTSSATDQDIFNLVISGNGGVVAVGATVGFKLDFLLVQPDGAGSVVSDYFSYSWDLSNRGQVNVLTALRGDFERVGTGGQGWESVYGIRMTLVQSSGGVSSIQVNNGLGSNFGFRGGQASIQNGTYQYGQVNVNNTGSYLAKSVLGVISGNITVNNGYTGVAARNPTLDDAQCNEAWIYRKGGQLDQWYRVLVFSGGSWTTKNDLMSDQDAIDLNIVLDLNLVSIAATTITDKIYDIVGPIEGRWYYFTTHFMYPSDINDPDLVNAAIAIRTTGANAELFLWARKVSDAAVLVGTTVDIYLLTGTYQTLPDGTVDIYYRSLGIKYPPITYDATVFEGSVYYLASDGWRLATPASFSVTYGGGANQLLVVPNTDHLYNGHTSYGYVAPNLLFPPGASRFPVLVARNKLWCCMPGTNRIEVFDFARKYWRVVKYGKGDVTAIANTQDGQILAFFNSDNKLRVIDNHVGGLLIDGVTKQTVNLLSPVFDGPLDAPTPRNRKDLYTFKCRFDAVADLLNVSLTDDQTNIHTIGSIHNQFAGTQEQYLDISHIVSISKSFQLTLTGQFSNLTISDMSVDFETRPTPTTFIRLYNNNFGNGSKKRVRVWPQIIDTRGSGVVFTPYVDQVAQASTTIITADKVTALVFFTTDVFGVDYGATLYDPSGIMEYWGALEPDIVQTLPIARQFDQVGPQELFRYGRVKQFELRVLPFGPSIPWNMFFSDNSVINGTLAVTPNVEASYFIGVPKTTGGSIVRIELGPTIFNFHRYYIRLQVMKSGADTELEWVVLPGGEG